MVLTALECSSGPLLTAHFPLATNNKVCVAQSGTVRMQAAGSHDCQQHKWMLIQARWPVSLSEGKLKHSGADTMFTMVNSGNSLGPTTRNPP